MPRTSSKDADISMHPVTEELNTKSSPKNAQQTR